ncbi:MAG: transcription termination/antitermination protein NusA [Candidatus Doudnabacteria bacterium]|nr:transcription termination/antitermination protein NusA [Candidatus Doudnabacteria bacterium]
MNEALEQALRQIEDEKGISREEILAMIEASLAAAFRKDYGNRDQNIEVEFNPEDLSAKIFDVKVVVETVEDPQKEVDLEAGQVLREGAVVGDVIRTEVTPEDGVEFGRIAAQTAKQVIIQKLREAERNMQFSDFKAKERTLINGLVHRVEGDTVLVDLGKGTGVLFPSEQIRGEQYTVGQRIKVLVLHVEPGQRGPKITLSRSHPDIVRKLFELEVPEIFNGIVEMKAVAREAGSRSKIAVFSTQEGIDPIGACVGQKGTRVQTVMAELGGEKIDIIEWSEDPVKFIANALSPAKILNVQLHEEEKSANVGVLEDQLSLAIGKAGQNVRLAARLTGWKIDINGEKIAGEATPAVVTEEVAVMAEEPIVE